MISTLHSPYTHPTLTLHSESFAKELLVCLRRYINNHALGSAALVTIGTQEWTKIISRINICELLMDIHGHSCSVADKRKVHEIHV